MTVDEARAVAMAYELRNLLGELFERPEHGRDSAVEEAWDRAKEIIDVLEGSRPFRSGAGRTLGARWCSGGSLSGCTRGE